MSVYAVFNRGDAEENYAAVQPAELKYVRVLAISNSLGEDIDVEAKNLIEEEVKEERERLPATITFLAGNLQAASLAGIDHNATIHVSLVARAENAEQCELFLAEQEAYILAVERGRTMKAPVRMKIARSWKRRSCRYRLSWRFHSRTLPHRKRSRS